MLGLTPSSRTRGAAGRLSETIVLELHQMLPQITDYIQQRLEEAVVLDAVAPAGPAERLRPQQHLVAREEVDAGELRQPDLLQRVGPGRGAGRRRAPDQHRCQPPSRVEPALLLRGAPPCKFAQAPFGLEVARRNQRQEHRGVRGAFLQVRVERDERVDALVRPLARVEEDRQTGQIVMRLELALQLAPETPRPLLEIGIADAAHVTMAVADEDIGCIRFTDERHRRRPAVLFRSRSNVADWRDCVKLAFWAQAPKSAGRSAQSGAAMFATALEAETEETSGQLPSISPGRKTR